MASKSFGLHLILKLLKLLMKHFIERTSQDMSNPKEKLQKIYFVLLSNWSRGWEESWAIGLALVLSTEPYIKLVCTVDFS